jgi:hypothetical protein
MPLGRLDHYSIRTPDVEASRRFWTGIYPAAKAAAR